MRCDCNLIYHCPGGDRFFHTDWVNFLKARGIY
jgi:hypothetical protein